MNLCRACGEDFGSVGAFDAHRIGKHAYDYLEGLRMEPMREDGRRCLDTAEMVAAGWGKDQNGRWRTPSRNGGAPFWSDRRSQERQGDKTGV